MGSYTAMMWPYVFALDAPEEPGADALEPDSIVSAEEIAAMAEGAEQAEVNVDDDDEVVVEREDDGKEVAVPFDLIFLGDD